MFLIDRHYYIHRTKGGNLVTIETTQTAPLITTWRADWLRDATTDDAKECAQLLQIVVRDVEAKVGKKHFLTLNDEKLL